MIKKIILLAVLFSVSLFSQAEYVEINNRVYEFLERMEAQHIISSYNEFEIPKTRREIGKYLKVIQQVQNRLNASDRLQFEDLTKEFDLEFTGGTSNTISVTGGDYNFGSDKSKYFFYDNGTSGTIFISLLAEADLIKLYTQGKTKSTTALLGKAGGEIRGTVLDKFGYSIKGTNGQATGDKQTALLKEELQYNLKFNENNENFYDETEGYFTADFDIVNFKIGRDRMNIGPGRLKPVIGSHSPNFDYLGLNINYSILSFSYFHGKLLGESIPQPDPVAGGSVKVVEKYIGYHRLNFEFSKHFSLGAGEMTIYGDRPIDLTYLNPFNFYKSVEHANRDRDNSLMFLDFTNNSIRNVKLYSLFMIDDLSFKKIGTSWWGNQFMFNAGILAASIGEAPLDLRLEYLRTEPYMFTHRLSRNSYTNYNRHLGSFAEPNSALYLAQTVFRFTGRISLMAEFMYYVHGANPLNPDGSIKENVGGDILTGHRVFDSQEAVFLAGELEYTRRTSVNLTIEPINQVIFNLRIDYINESLQNRLSQEKIESFLNLSLKI